MKRERQIQLDIVIEIEEEREALSRSRLTLPVERQRDAPPQSFGPTDNTDESPSDPLSAAALIRAGQATTA